MQTRYQTFKLIDALFFDIDPQTKGYVYYLSAKKDSKKDDQGVLIAYTYSNTGLQSVDICGDDEIVYAGTSGTTERSSIDSTGCKRFDVQTDIPSGHGSATYSLRFEHDGVYLDSVALYKRKYVRDSIFMVVAKVYPKDFGKMRLKDISKFHSMNFHLQFRRSKELD